MRNDFIFFTRIKSLNTSGYFSTKDHLVRFQKVTGLCKTSVRDRLNSLINRGLAYEVFNKKGKKVGISLASYDKLWYDILGYNKRDENDVNGFEKCFKIYKIPTDKLKHLDDLIDQIFGFDCYKKMQRCRYEAKKKNNLSCSIPTNGANGIQFSQLSMALYFGYTSRMTGYRIQQRLSKKGILKVTHREKIVDKMHITTYKRDYALFHSGKTYFKYTKGSRGFGNVMERLCNELWVNLDSLFLPNNNSKPSKNEHLSKDKH